jgi:hypothetical protein
VIAQEELFSNSNLPSRLKEELLYALKATPQGDVSDWGKRIGTRFLTVGVKRVANLGSLLSRLAMGTADELVGAIGAVAGGRAGAHFEDRATALSDKARSVQQGIASAFQGIATFFRDKPDEAAVGLLSSVVGFYLGIGHGKDGFGDGGIPDLDLTFGGIGWHRSIFTHSIIAGAFVETAVLSLIDLNKTVHSNLPTRHSPFWDDLLRYGDAAGNPFVTGASLGIASHLGIDTAIDGFTPYKDLPISLPMGAHEFLMGMNSLAEGAYGAGRLREQTYFGASEAPRASSHRNPSDPEKGSFVYQQIKNPSANIDAMDKHLYGMSAEERIARIGEMAREAALAIGVDPTFIDESLSCARRQIEAAKEPFRLGVIGEFRVGKSTLINALIGQEIAFADIVEATASECRFRHGASNSATFIYADREPEELGVEEANRILSDRREDARWLGSLDHVEYSVDADCLRSFDLWDAPGIGGSEVNERLANRFIERLGGALWVMDANLVGKASIAGPLNQLKTSGKPVICVLNRIDEYSGDPTEIIHFIERSYPGVFSAIVPISAYTAFLDKISGRSSPDLDDLWSIVLSVMGGDEAQGGETRLQGTIGIAGKKVGCAVVALKRELQDRIGLVEHMRYNLRAAGAKLFIALPQVLAEETEKAFTALETELWKLVDDAKGDRKDAPIPVDRVITFLKDERRLSALTETVTGATMQRLNHMWSSLTDDAFNLSLAAVSLPSNALSTFSVARAAGSETQLTKQAIEEGVYVGGVSAVIAGTLAAASTLVTWPVILVAIPIGALAAWREQKKADAPTIEFSEQVSKLLFAMKQQFVVTLGRQIKGAIESAIEVEIDHSLQQRTIDITGAHDVQVARELENRLVLMADALNVPSHQATRSEWSGADVLAMLENPGSRLDLYLPEISFSLSSLLVSLPPETEIRVLVAATRNGLAGLPDEVDRAFGGWAGKKRVRSITNATGDALVGLPTMIIVSEEALVTDESLRGLSNQGMRFEPYAQGRVAAQRLFASLWEGRGRGGESLEVAPVL